MPWGIHKTTWTLLMRMAARLLALTDHGNMNGMAYQVLHAKKMKAEGKNFKPIFGVEAYFIPSLKSGTKSGTR